MPIGRSAHIALHSSTMPGSDVFDVVAAARSAGCRRVCAYVNAPVNGVTMPGAPPKTFPLIRPDQVETVLAHLRDADVTLPTLEFFPIGPDTEVDTFLEPLETAARLQARRVVVHMHDPEFNRAAQSLGRLTEAASNVGVDVALEFVGMAKGCRTLDEAVALTAAVGRPGCRIAVDALHFFRTGGDLDVLRALPSSRIAYGQLCDANPSAVTFDYFPDARNRLRPGEGALPLRAFILALGDADLDVEVPRTTLAEEGLTNAAHAALCLKAAGEVLNAVESAIDAGGAQTPDT